MPDENDQPLRTREDKDRSRQQSRAVSSKEAARGTGSRANGPKKGSSAPGAANRSSQRGPTSRDAAGSPKRSNQGAGRPPSGGAQRGSGGGGRGGRPAVAGRRSRPPSGPRRSPTALLTWGVVALVLVIVVVLVIVKITSSSTSSAAPPPGPVPAVVAHEVTHVPMSVYNTVGVTSPTVTVKAPVAIKGQPTLTSNGKPEVFYMGGEFCPYCAAERWAMVTAFSRFGTLSGLKTMESSATDVDPSTQTFSFVDAHLTSSDITLTTREYYSNQLNSAGTGYLVLQPLTKSEQALVSKYDTAKYTGGSTTSSGSIPFVDIGNKFLVAGASYSPTILQGLKRTAIAANLSTPKNVVTKAIIASANYLSASICSIDGQSPAAVCTSKGVTAADKAMGLSS